MLNVPSYQTGLNDADSFTVCRSLSHLVHASLRSVCVAQNHMEDTCVVPVRCSSRLQSRSSSYYVRFVGIVTRLGMSGTMTSVAALSPSPSGASQAVSSGCSLAAPLSSLVTSAATVMPACVELCPRLREVVVGGSSSNEEDLGLDNGGDVCMRRGDATAALMRLIGDDRLTRWTLTTRRRKRKETSATSVAHANNDLQWCIYVSLVCSLRGGGCRQSTEARDPHFSHSSQHPSSASGGTPTQGSTPRHAHGGTANVVVPPSLMRPNAPIPPPLRGIGASLGASAKSTTPLGTPSQRRGTPAGAHHASLVHAHQNGSSPPGGGLLNNSGHNHLVGASYTRHGDEDDALVTVHALDDALSEVDVHYVQDDGFVDLPGGHQGGGARGSGPATSDRSYSRQRTRKSVSELSRASSRGTSASFVDAVVSGAASEFNEAAPNGHSDVVLRRLFIDHSVATGELGRGGYGVVYRAHDQQSGAKYAVKEASYGKTGSDGLMNNLRAEFRTLSQLVHPNIVRVYNFLIDEEEQTARIVMELATNGSVRKLLSRSSSTTPNSPSVGSGGGAAGRLSESVARRVVFQCLLGLQHLHRHGIIHRDIKPDNILLSDDSVVKLSDFGTCKSTIHASTGTTTTVVGTVCYMSPESIAGTFSTGSDIWSVGATTIELLSGLAPWNELRCMQSIHLVFQIGSARPPKHRPAFPAPQLGISRLALQFLEACTIYDAKQRPTSTDLLSFKWFEGIYDELPLTVRRYLDANPVPPSRWKTPTATGAAHGGAPLLTKVASSPALAPPSTRIAPNGKTVERTSNHQPQSITQQQIHQHNHRQQQQQQHRDPRAPHPSTTQAPRGGSHHDHGPRVNHDDSAALGRVGVWHQDDDDDDDDTFETWPEDRDEGNDGDEEVVVAGEDEYEYEYV